MDDTGDSGADRPACSVGSPLTASAMVARQWGGEDGHVQGISLGKGKSRELGRDEDGSIGDEPMLLGHHQHGFVSNIASAPDAIPRVVA